jgi:hypothetical protein
MPLLEIITGSVKLGADLSVMVSEALRSPIKIGIKGPVGHLNIDYRKPISDQLATKYEKLKSVMDEMDKNKLFNVVKSGVSFLPFGGIISGAYDTLRLIQTIYESSQSLKRTDIESFV